MQPSRRSCRSYLSHLRILSGLRLRSTEMRSLGLQPTARARVRLYQPTLAMFRMEGFTHHHRNRTFPMVGWAATTPFTFRTDIRRAMDSTIAGMGLQALFLSMPRLLELQRRIPTGRRSSRPAELGTEPTPSTRPRQPTIHCPTLITNLFSSPCIKNGLSWTYSSRASSSFPCKTSTRAVSPPRIWS